EISRKFFEEKLKIDLKNKFIIGSIGRLDYAKNYEFLINVFPEILKIKNNAICLIIGEGMEREKYQKLIKKLNLENKIFLIGEIKNAAQYIKGFDLFILPSRYEGLSITLIEALFAGVPILTTNVGGNAEIVVHSPQQLYELNDQSSFLEKFKNLVSNSQLCREIAEQNKISGQQFLLKNTADNYLKIYF
ncbi:MAG: glycosyltransferase, partial [Candidatus Margulisbacteria bacterium]|nr:glycosyltransferase [Candidatus Margulisiibacteriota bacterium]